MQPRGLVLYYYDDHNNKFNRRGHWHSLYLGGPMKRHWGYPYSAALPAFMLACSVRAETLPLTPDIPPSFERPTADTDFLKRYVMIPMRDGVKLHTVIVVPKGASGLPIMLTRTPYNAAKRVERAASTTMLGVLPLGDEVLAKRGYIRVFQDVRGKYRSEGDYVMTRPLRGPLNDSEVDHSTDAYDTIEWLANNIPESNGRVGIIGSSYEGFTALMALVNPHPALKVAVPISPVVDNWKGDDWFHNGAFRQINFHYLYRQNTARGDGQSIARNRYDDYEDYLSSGSAGDYARRYGIDRLPFYRKLVEHPTYDRFWQAQAFDKIIAAHPLLVPTMYVGSLWDQEDMYGAVAAYEAAEPRDTNNDRNYLVLGPWRHSGANYYGSSLGPLKFDGDTSLQFRRDVLQPFIDRHLKDDAAVDIPPVYAFETGSNVWRRIERWPLTCSTGCTQTSQPLYLQSGFGLGLAPPRSGQASASFDEYVSDPAKPVPYVRRPIRFDDAEAWATWLVSDQRSVADRTDVLVYTSEVLEVPLQISGAPVVHLYASTSGSDSDWIVKLIDVYPDQVPSQPEMGGYQLGVGMDIFRGRYRENFEHPTPIAAGEIQLYRFALPAANHVFQPGHRIMVHIQSSWFPLYDRNPQTFVKNIFFAEPRDYKKATQRIYRGGAAASYIDLPLVRAQ